MPVAAEAIASHHRFPPRGVDSSLNYYLEGELSRPLCQGRRSTCIGNGSAGAIVAPWSRADTSFSRSGSRIRDVHAPCRSHTAEQAAHVSSIDPPDEISTSTWAPS